ncbi:MAG: polysaccharide deacetylase family protein [Paracoccaceae bacterium]
MSSRTETGNASDVDILMYHSISDAAGPTSIREPVFRAQMAALADADASLLSLDDFLAWHGGRIEVKAPAVVLTFDDGFADFSSRAWPVIRDFGWPVAVFLPTSHVGSVEGWKGIAQPPRRLMSWDEISRLAGEGVGFEAHSASHPDLRQLDDARLEQEIVGCMEVIEHRTGRRPRHFAPPYGLATAATRAAIARHCASSCGTRLDRAGRASDIYDLPRLEMLYFTDIGRWRAHLAGRGGAYLGFRKGMRSVRNVVSKPWNRM